MKTKTAELLRVIADIIELDDKSDAPDASTPSSGTIQSVISNYISLSGFRFLTIVQLMESSGYRASAILDACAGSSDDTGLVVSVRREDNIVLIRLA